jgi:RNA polymerase II subunit A small phosphatase-like protein
MRNNSSYNSSNYTSLKNSISSNYNNKKSNYSSRIGISNENNLNNRDINKDRKYLSNYQLNNSDNFLVNKRGISANLNTNSRYINNNSNYISNIKLNSGNSFNNTPKDSFSPNNLIHQQTQGSTPNRMTSNLYNSINLNSPRQDNYRISSSVAPSNKFNSGIRNPNKFLPDKTRDIMNKKTLILDLDETLVHSGFKPFFCKSDIILNIDLDRKDHVVHVLKRPGVDEFLERMAKIYEVVIFTASLSAYANPLIDQLDKKRCVSHRLFREHCTPGNGVFVKDMKKVGRDLKDIILVDVK